VNKMLLFLYIPKERNNNNKRHIDLCLLTTMSSRNKGSHTQQRETYPNLISMYLLKESSKNPRG